MQYSLKDAFIAYITYIEHFRTLEYYRKGAKAIRKGLPPVDKTKKGWRDILEIKNFVEWVLTADDEIVTLACCDDGASTIEVLSEEASKIMMLNPEEIEKVLIRQD